MLNIYIDESGSFAHAKHHNSWNLTSAFVVPTINKRDCSQALKQLKIDNGFKHSDEIKLKDVSESSYLNFLNALSKTSCTLYSVATDAGTQSVEDIEAQRDKQANKIEEHKDKMQYPKMAKILEDQANQIRKLSPQLYLQLLCQTALMSDVVRKSILFYVQRLPKQLNAFRWRIDEKTAGKSDFEQSFRALAPPFLQSESLRKPDIHITDFDYSAMEQFLYTKDTKPTYLKEQYGIETSPDGGLDIRKLIWDDFKFVDSQNEEGVQIIDLIVSGLRRTLRGGFENDKAISEALGGLMVENIDNSFPMHFISTSQETCSVSSNAGKASIVFKKNQKPIFK